MVGNGIIRYGRRIRNMAIAALIATGAGLQAASQLKQGNIAEAQGKMAKAIGEFNAQQLERQKDTSVEAARLEAVRIGEVGRRAVGRETAKAGKGGVAGGSVIDSLADTAFQFAMDSALTFRAGFLRGQALETQAGFQRVSGRWAYTLGKQQKRISQFKAASTILSGAFSASGALPTGGGGVTSVSSANTV